MSTLFQIYYFTLTSLYNQRNDVKILVFGITGLIGSSLFRALSASPLFEVFGTCRKDQDKKYFSKRQQANIFSNIDVFNYEQILKLLKKNKPNVIINCIGITKHSPEINNRITTISINALWPHQLAKLASDVGAKVIHLSTDCVFSGMRGNYSEIDMPDAIDLYGRTKILGEVTYNNHLTLRISTIGHEIKSSYGLLNWFLLQKNACNGYSKAIFSGLPTIFFAKVLSDYVLPNEDLIGLYHVSAKPIDKFTLLKLIALEYQREIKVISDESLIIDRSLDGTKFASKTGFICPDWPELIKIMASTNGIYENV
jgi:dTDP-4-dehydrorhamnose reductase